MNLWKKTTATALIASLCLSATVQVFAEKTSKSEETPTQTVNIVAEETNKENVENRTIEDTKENVENRTAEDTKENVEDGTVKDRTVEDIKENVENKIVEEAKEKQEVVTKKKATTKKANVEKKATTKKKTSTTKKVTKKSSTKKETKKVNLGTFKVYAYSSGGITASGARTKANHTVAVDPKVIPLGSKIMVNGKIYKAEDTGGAIKGKKLDIYMPSESACRNWGVRNCTVYLLKE